MNKSTRDKLSKAAKRSYETNVNFKNQQHPKTCAGCGLRYTAKTANGKYCVDCRQLGRPNICVFCHQDYRTRGDTKYCQLCMQTKTYLRGKTRLPETINKVRDGYNRWKETDEAKKTFARVGKQNSENLKRRFSTLEGKRQIHESSKKQSVTMKRKILEGEFTPNITNSFTHWDAVVEYNGETKRFRSSWEACVWLSNPILEYETIRIPLPNGSSVITDFLDSSNRIIYEIKPKSFWRKQQHKVDAIIDYCLTNDYKFIWINEENILDFIDTSMFESDFNKKQLEVMLNGIKTNKNKIVQETEQ
jgi:hypothetical protein